MASGATHTAIAIAGGPLLAAAALYMGYSWQESLVAGGLEIFAGTLMTPDMDTQCMWSKVWGNTWFIYKNRMAHRSFWSHGPIVGTAGRLLYLGGLLSAACFLVMCVTWALLHHTFAPIQYLADIRALWIDGFSRLSWLQMRDSFGALEVGAMLHVAADYTSTRWKQLRKHSGPVWSFIKLVTLADGGIRGVAWYEGAHHR